MIQENINKTLENSIKNKDEKYYIEELRFLKAELQRGKNKEVSDIEAINTLVKIYKNQEELILKSEIDSKLSNDAYSLIANIIDFLPIEINDELSMSDIDITTYILKNFSGDDFTNKNKLIGQVKKHFKYIDGNRLKTIIEKL